MMLVNIAFKAFVDIQLLKEDIVLESYFIIYIYGHFPLELTSIACHRHYRGDRHNVEMDNSYSVWQL